MCVCVCICHLPPLVTNNLTMLILLSTIIIYNNMADRLLKTREEWPTTLLVPDIWLTEVSIGIDQHKTDEDVNSTLFFVDCVCVCYLYSKKMNTTQIGSNEEVKCVKRRWATIDQWTMNRRYYETWLSLVTFSYWYSIICLVNETNHIWWSSMGTHMERKRFIRFKWFKWCSHAHTLTQFDRHHLCANIK